MLRLRKEAANRQRRLIFNNDGNESVYLPAGLKPTPKDIISLRTAPLIDSQVDTISYCTSRAFGMVLHDTKVWEAMAGETRANEKGYYADKRNVVGELISGGTDALEIMSDFAREHDKEIFWSMRMNDIHDATNPSMLPRFKKDHPEYLFGSLQSPPPYRGYSGVWGANSGAVWGGYSGVDYAHEAVREQAFRILKEVCEHYDIDGVELDFFRNPVLFKSQAWGGDVSQEERDSLTQFMQRVQKMTQERSLQRGRPVLVMIRVPDSVAYCRSIGIDLERWLKEGLTDLLVVGGDFRLMPWEESVALGAKYDVPVYACLTFTGRSDPPEYRLRSTPEAYRARAMNAWDAGVDGVYLFNQFDPHSPQWKELGDPAQLKKLDKVYYGSELPLTHLVRYHREGARFHRLPRLSPEHPETLLVGKKVTSVLTVGEDVLSGQPGVAPKVSLGLRANNSIDSRSLVVTLNGHALSDGALAEGWLNFALKPEWVPKGSNEITISPRHESVGEAEISDLRLHVSYGK